MSPHEAPSSSATLDVARTLPLAPIEHPGRVETWRPAARPLPENPAVLERARRTRRAQERRKRTLHAALTAFKVGLVLFITYGLVFNFSVVRGSSMSPGIHDGDRILVDHLSYMFRDVQRGDIVVLQYPLDPSLDYIKRVIGVPGDRVRIENGAVWVNGKRLSEPYIAEADPRTRMVQTVAADSFFVLGDNRPHSSDSREFGQVPRQNLVGKVDVRVWPPERAGILD